MFKIGEKVQYGRTPSKGYVYGWTTQKGELYYLVRWKDGLVQGPDSWIPGEHLSRVAELPAAGPR